MHGVDTERTPVSDLAEFIRTIDALNEQVRRLRAILEQGAFTGTLSADWESQMVSLEKSCELLQTLARVQMLTHPESEDVWMALSEGN